MAILLSPWFWLAALLSVLSLLGTGFYQGYQYAKADTAKEQLAAQVIADKQEIKQARIDRETAQTYEAVREQVRTVYVTVREKAHENIINNPDYGECSLDDDGLRLYNAKPETATAGATGSIDSAVPGSAGSNRRSSGFDFPQQPGAVGPVLRLSGAPQGVDGMGDAGFGRTGRLTQ